MEVKVLQWNVWQNENPKHIVRQIKAIDPDIVCAQELIQKFTENIDTAKYLADKLGYDYFFHQAETWDDNKKGVQGNAIFSRYRISNTSATYIKSPVHNPATYSDEGRVYVESKIKIGKSIYYFGTVHLSYSDNFEITDERKKEVDNLIHIIDKKKNKYIFAADLNSAPESYTVKQISKYLKNAGPSTDQKTWTTKPFETEGFFERNLNWRLDYIFTTQDIQVVDSKIIHSKYSDHLPLLSVISI